MRVIDDAIDRLSEMIRHTEAEIAMWSTPVADEYLTSVAPEQIAERVTGIAALREAIGVLRDARTRATAGR